MSTNNLSRALTKIDEYNLQDPNKINIDGRDTTREYIYSLRISEKLGKFCLQASEALQIAARSHHIGRWEIPRSSYPEGRAGYLRWRNDLKKHHSGITADILHKVGYAPDFVNRVTALVEKKNLKNDVECQTLEDVICLVFLEHYLHDFSLKKDDEKLKAILRKTFKKMSREGLETVGSLSLSERVKKLLAKAKS